MKNFPSIAFLNPNNYSILAFLIQIKSSKLERWLKTDRIFNACWRAWLDEIIPGPLALEPGVRIKS
jgi:hypothetical protein